MFKKRSLRVRRLKETTRHSVIIKCIPATYGRIVNEEVDVEAEGDGDGDQADQLVQLNLAALLPRQLLDLDPLGHLANEALALAMPLLCGGVLRARLGQDASSRPTQALPIAETV